MNLTRRTLAKVAAMLTLSGSIPAIAKASHRVQQPTQDSDMIGLMHYVEPNTLFNGDMKHPYGYWATSYVDSLDEIPKWGDSFSHWPDIEMGPAGIPTAEQQLELDHQSFEAAHHDMMTEFIYGE